MIKHFIHRIIQNRVFKGVPAELDKVQKQLDSVETWLVRNAVILALAIIAVGLGFRVYYAVACYLNPDEAIHVGLAQAEGLKQAYLKSHTQAHPPLLTLVLYFFLKFGSSEFMVRLPSLLGSTLAAWFGFQWARRVFGAGAAIGMLGLITFSPAMAFTAIEVRQYGLLLMGIGGVLYGLERAFEEQSWKWMGFGYAFLYLAILSNYSALLITGTVSCYGILRLYQLGAKRRIWIAWVGYQAGAALLYIFLYVTHIRYMRSGWMQKFAVNDYLKNGYFHGGDQSLLEFFGSRLFHLFRYMTGNYYAGYIAMALFAGGVIILLFIPAKREGIVRRDLSLLLVMPIIFGCVGALLHILPFIGTRHISYLLLFLAAGISYPVFRWVKHKTLTAAIICLFGPAWLMWSMAGPEVIPNNIPEMLPREQMTRALEFLSAEVPMDQPLFVDLQTSLELQYYLGKKGPKRLKVKPWSFNRKNFLPLLRGAEDKNGIKPGQRLWAMSTGWYKLPSLTKVIPESLQVRDVQFGQISLVLFTVPAGLPEGKKK